MKKLKNPSLVILSLLFILCMSISSKAQTSPERDIKALGEIDPYEVTIYSDYKYINPIGKWKIQYGMRMLKVPKLDNVPRSIHVGSKVGVIFFPNKDFYSNLREVSAYKENFGSDYKTPTKFYLVPYFEFKTSNPAISYKSYEKVFKPCSLIIYRMDRPDILGVHLQDKEECGQFYPLPENANDSAIIYYNVLNGGPFVLNIIHTGKIYHWSPTSHTKQWNIQITVKSVQGIERKIPGPNDQTGVFDLNKLGIYKISSLKLEYKGPLGGQAYLPPKTHRAPPAVAPHKVKVITAQKTADKKDMNTGPVVKPQTGAVIPSKPRFELSDTDRPGNNYRNFDLQQPDLDFCLDACQKDSRCKAFTYVKPGVQGPKARCWLKDAVPSEKPSDCCISGVRR